MKKGLLIFLGIIFVIFIALHFLLEPVALHYANEAIDNMEGYDGHIDGVGIQLYRGAYSIDSLTLQKIGDEDTISPFFTVSTIGIEVTCPKIGLHQKYRGVTFPFPTFTLSNFSLLPCVSLIPSKSSLALLPTILLTP